MTRFSTVSSVVMFAMVLNFTGQGFTDVITLGVTAMIDGRDLLIVQGNHLQWHHLENAAVGRHEQLNLPTVITTTLNGSVVMNGFDWTPGWSLPVPDEIRFEDYSSVLTGLNPVIPSQDMTVSLWVIDARSSMQIVQNPTADNAFTTILEFDDNPPGSHAWYRGVLIFSPPGTSDTVVSEKYIPPIPLIPVPDNSSVPEPSTLGLLGLGGLLLLGYRKVVGRR
jgi:hypothetical protein